ncbi:UDP-N-acetylmuramate dehydrogenase [Paenibacillus thermotolerans]|uniref:UDP-N-acetylmuramate dehydrogenase n=1 Tax=Paenibacillus thermotolerans TaxID=3027807 RepID=UPI002367FCBD|nr:MULTISPECIES: UDP-N-acetylmuramate dehydrogenase [unclassified Paenibacillus]
MRQLIDQLRASEVGDIYPNERLANHTTWKIGGPADVLVVPKGKRELADTIRIAGESGVPWTTIGRGSNVLVSDEGIAGIVIKLGKAFDYVRFEDTLVIAGGAYSFIKLSVMSGQEGLTGLEFAGGIPGSVGGAVYMNAGAMSSDVSRILKSAEVILSNGELAVWSAEDFQFAYRHSSLHKTPAIVTEAVFRLKHGDRREIAAMMAAYKERRLRTQPLADACAGSVFRNPEGTHAAKLIEEAGLKGTRVGGAEVSTLHANFIVNTGNATAEDVLALMKHIQQTVEQKFGIRLVPEVLEVGGR